MPTQPPEPNPADPDKAQRLGGDLEQDLVYRPPGFHGQPHGPGRWCPLFMAGKPLGYLWTNDTDGLGFRATTDPGRVRTAEFTHAFQQAAKVGATPTEVFDWWAGMASLGLAAGPVETGDLDTLPG